MKAAPSHPLIDRAEEVRLSAASIEAVGSELPRSQPEVEALLVEAIEGNFARAFTLLSLAALNEGIVVDAALMVHGVRLLPDPRYVAKLVGRVSGDIAEVLVGEVEGRRLSWEREAASLFLAAWWAQERELTHHNVSIARRARILAREPLGIESQLLLVAAGEILSDANFDLLMSRMAAAQSPAAAAMVADALLEYAKQPITWNVDDEDESAHVSTRRRSVARVGRNDPCPCGSGKKYKRCCIDKDQERLRDSSDIVGVTQAELRRELEDFLTLERINGLRAHELVRLDPKRIDPKLHRAVLNRLNQFWEIEAVRHFFAAVGVEGLEGHFMDAIDRAIESSNLNEARALLALHDAPEERWVGFPFRFLKRGIEEVEALDILNGEASRFIDDGAIDLAIDLLKSPWPYLGILVARGVAPHAPFMDLDTLLGELGRTRDRLDLAALDPIEDTLDLWGWRDELDDDADWTSGTPRVASDARQDVSGSVQAQLDTKEDELGRLRKELSGLREQIETQEPSEPPAVPEPHAPERKSEDPEPGRLAELKQRVDSLKGELNQRHTERNDLRRQLERERKKVHMLEAEHEATPQTTLVDEAESEPDNVDLSEPTRFRVPVFTKRVRASLQHLPDATKRHALVLVSRIAAGDHAALRGTRRLAADRTVWRQRVGRDYRVLFRMTDEELEVLDVVHRQDLERTVRLLK